MAEIIQDLKLQNDPTTIVRPNIVTESIPSGAVTSDKIATGAVTSDKIATGAVTSDKIATGAVISDKIATGAVTNDKIATGAVTANKITAKAVIASKLNVKNEVLEDLLQLPITTLSALALQLVDLFTSKVVLALYVSTDGYTYYEHRFSKITSTEIVYDDGLTTNTISSDQDAERFVEEEAPRIIVKYIGA